MSKQNEFNQNFKDIIEEGLLRAKKLQDKLEQPFFTSQYPYLEEDFLDAFNEFILAHVDGIQITKENLIIKENDTFEVDSDGFPYLKSSIEIKDIDLTINFVIYHHTDWDFYLDN